MATVRRNGSRLATPLCGWRPTFQEKITSSTAIGLPSPHFAPLRMRQVMRRPFRPLSAPSAKVKTVAPPFSTVGSVSHSRQTSFHC